ncbi:MAG TPA: hypothetical protein IAA98_06180 [Candidatus Avipropionibacterium avicola]|uniref:Uncharacterized protein n=1 Tax=Candidatus Avipropionibacterium avicola TaxID=2840701 RepID=A0A9D1KMV9_9ACTN|nr:hypothetical protein [Candidatus Avipropionibacterium avicola]
MADTDWDALGSELYTLLGMTKEGGTLWQAWEHAKTSDHDEFSNWQWNYPGAWGSDPWDYYNEAVADAEAAYGRFHSTWTEHFYADRSFIPAFKYKTELWLDDVAEPIRNEPYTLETGTRVRESWNGPSAQKYDSALRTQVSAANEYFSLTTTLATELNNANNVLKGVYLSIKQSIEPVRDKLNAAEGAGFWENGITGGTFFDNVAYGKAQFEGLATWLSDMASDGDWVRNMSRVRTNLEDAKTRVTSFRDGWPKSTTGDLTDMSNGRAEGAGDPASQTSTSEPTDLPDIDPDAEASETETDYEQEGYNEGLDGGGNENDEVNPTEEQG